MKCARALALKRRGSALLWLAIYGTLPGSARAADPLDSSTLATEPSAPTLPGKATRSAIVMGWIGDLTPEQRTVLEQLLQGELAGGKPARTLDLSAANGAAWAWIATAQRNPQALLVVLLEAQESGTWRVYLVDAARSRAIVRELPGEARGNSAALETIVSIVSSAVRALDDGLEIASRPVAEVMGEPRPAAPRALEPRHPEVAPVPRRLQLLGGLGPALSTFAKSAPVTLGMCADVRLVLPSGLLFRVSLLPTWPARFQSEFGSFEVQRTRGELSVGAELSQGAWQFSFDAGPAVELLRRRALSAEPGTRSSGNTNLTRLGGELTLTAGLRVSKRFGLELALGGGYFPEQIRYTLSPATDRVLASPWLASASAQLGLDFWLLH